MLKEKMCPEPLCFLYLYPEILTKNEKNINSTYSWSQAFVVFSINSRKSWKQEYSGDIFLSVIVFLLFV